MAERIPEPVPAVALSGIRKSYGSVEVLHGVSLAAHEGEVISILGSSGSGKSTLLRCVNMLEVPNDGTVAIQGEEIRIDRRAGRPPRPSDAAQVQRLRSRAAMVFQSFNLWSHLTILENIIEAPVHVQGRDRKDCIAEGEALLERVGIAAKRNFYPAHLSGGQQQRAAIARALAMHPAIMLFDEPTSALDPELVGEVLKVMRDLAAEGRTMLVVTHEMAFARDVSTRTVFLHKGVIEEEGSSADVFARPHSERFRQFLARA
ncbi:octopine/nopaline transport system ATP-binding protein [Azospirillum lipoferum]|uniref:ATP-binding cassette domain-containing protein n=1 Tax=Azospirillum lipoferum TaxID=193 RepID=A0A5A9GNK7_AZOLI|nr:MULTISPECIES: ATP-binding cassette domain-containing protein [Azospirillum]KAA0595977.1 ATP-binding cassette domain-containing protein [Azospirillum lipoferum]MCP1610880.1 octopine/nopaline transport system ATP-binding protein [Azospirillum lipoferum]MDW5533973.1 ATP-binding cassette domain-containing protein [Azospirillum sp. NL1]